VCNVFSYLSPADVDRSLSNRLLSSVLQKMHFQSGREEAGDIHLYNNNNNNTDNNNKTSFFGSNRPYEKNDNI